MAPRQEESADSNLKTSGEPILQNPDQVWLVSLSDPELQGFKEQGRARLTTSRLSNISQRVVHGPLTPESGSGYLLILQIPIHTQTSGITFSGGETQESAC